VSRLERTYLNHLVLLAPGWGKMVHPRSSTNVSNPKRFPTLQYESALRTLKHELRDAGASDSIYHSTLVGESGNVQAIHSEIVRAPTSESSLFA
jgi:hypothetical protein